VHDSVRFSRPSSRVWVFYVRCWFCSLGIAQLGANEGGDAAVSNFKAGKVGLTKPPSELLDLFAVTAVDTVCESSPIHGHRQSPVRLQGI
jgi:hypothetical protein